MTDRRSPDRRSPDRRALDGDPEFRALMALSAEVGADPLLVQAAGGNVSLKRGGVLWIKASGTWLKDALERDLMVPVDLDALRAAMAAGDRRADRGQAFVRRDLDVGGLRPSIETTVHCCLPQTVVVHVHCVETIAWSTLADAETALAAPLAGLNWAFIPYVRPGLPLARAIVARTGPETDVVILGNHGLVVAGDSVAAAADLLRDVSTRLRRPCRAAPDADLARLRALGDGSGYRLPKHASAHAAATDPLSRALAAAGSLYPDHVIFLGPAATVLALGETPAQAVARAAARDRPPPVLLLVPGAGVLLAEDVSAGAEELAPCLSAVTARLGSADRVNYLTADQDAELTGWDAERYRRQLDKAAGTGP